ncbi:MAG TPA: heavy metal translocating P-type ATPase, partial [Acidimicrobiaceae bacterium]|nr:heavy metal translocating P-type ATPase [Acidimicrobiaceae bacterium]
MADACCAHDGDPGGADDAPTNLWQIREIQLAAVSGVLLAAGWLAGGSASDVLFVAALAVGGWTFIPGTLRALLKGRIGVGTLMTIAAVGAVVLGELGEAASLAFLFSISEALEGYAMARTRRGLRALLALVPDRVTVRRGGTEIGIDPAELVVGDVMIARPGERLATDGVVRVGRSTLDLSAITGESVPVEIDAGQQVFAASINGGGVLEIEATASTSDSSLARVVHIVEEAQERKGTSQRLAERIAQPLVPAIMVVAAAIAVVGSLLGDPELWVGRALVVLVAAAPCAFAISVPVTVVTAIGAAAKMGALVKGGAALEALADIDVVALDKTGT